MKPPKSPKPKSILLPSSIAIIIIICGVGLSFGQTPTLRIQTDDPNLPSDLYYGNAKVKPLRLRPGTNPAQFITIDDDDFFVQQQYIDFLNRMPDTAGFGFWLNQITSCGSNQSCIEVARINDSGAFFLSIEFQETGYLVERMYKAAYGDASDTSQIGGPHTVIVPIVKFSEFVSDVKQIGKGVVVNLGDWQAQLENNKTSFSQTFVQRPRFTTAYPTNSTTPTAFVDALFQKAGVKPATSERNQAIGEFHSASDISDVAARARALRDVAENPKLSQQETNKAFVLMQYFGYLRRDPNSRPDVDYTGYDFWLTKLNQFNGDFIAAEMVKAFITAIEYKNRF